MTPRQFAQRVRGDLRARRWLRWHCSLIGTLTLLAAWACSHALMRAGTDALSLRYGLSFIVAYGVLLVLLYLWARWLLSRDEGADPQVDGGAGSDGGSRADKPSFESGQGGDFGGAGGGGSFDAADATSALAESAGEAAGSTLDVVGAADEGALVLIPLALVIGLALALGAALGFVVFGLFGVEVLLAVAVEIALAAVGGAVAYKAGAEGWLGAAWRRTRMAAAAGLIGMVTLGAAIDHWVPEARSLPQALKWMRSV
jgi:hypothetical protein